MNVKELIDILQTCDPNLPVATHANNHDYMSGSDGGTHGKLRVVLLHTYGGDHVMIGNPSRKKINPQNWYIVRELDGGEPIPKEWPRYVNGRWNFDVTKDCGDYLGE